MPHARNLAFSLFGVATVLFTFDAHMYPADERRPVGPLERARARGEVAGAPRLDPGDPMANAAVIAAALDEAPCAAGPRAFATLVDGRLSWVRFEQREVCQLQELKRISVAQPGHGPRGVGEVGAFVLGRRRPDGRRVDVTRVVVPPFYFTGDSLTFLPADLGGLAPGEQFIGTYHTHPDGDIEQGGLSLADLRFLRTGFIDFHGRVGALAEPSPDRDWLFDIVDTRGGDWNVFAHDAARLGALLDECATSPACPLAELRLVGSRYYLLTRYYVDEVAAVTTP